MGRGIEFAASALLKHLDAGVLAGILILFIRLLACQRKRKARIAH